MEWSRIGVLHGANRWNRGPVLVADLRLDEAERAQISPEMIANLAVELQRQSGSPVDFHAVETTADPHIHRIIIALEEAAIAQLALRLAGEIVHDRVHGIDPNLEGRIAELKAVAYDARLGPSTAAIVRAATARGIPFRRVGSGSLVFFGQGVHQRRVCTAETGFTSAIAETIAQDKELTRSLLQSIGVPVPRGRTVDSLEDAWKAAQELGLPVVVKPQYGNHGRGVATNLITREQVEHAYHIAYEEEPTILVEQFIEGDDYRMLVIGGKLVAAARREPAHVIGDGMHTIRELIDIINRDPRRSDGHGTVLSIIKLDASSLAVLAEQGFSTETIPAINQKVLIRRTANLSTGGTATDVTALVHPEMAARVVEAAMAVGLDIAGIDVVCRDITQPMEAQRGGVIEVNAGPGLRMHLEPSGGSPQPVGEAIVDLLYRAGETGRVPVVLVGGGPGRASTASAIANMLRVSGYHVGHAGEHGITINGRPIPDAIGVSANAARAILGNPRITAAVLELDSACIDRDGLGVDRATVAVVVDREMKPTGDDLTRVMIESVAVDGTIVLAAEESFVRHLADGIPTKTATITLVSDHEGSSTLRTHVANGGQAVGVRDGAIIRLTDQPREQVLEKGAFPTGPGVPRLAAIATARALNLPDETILATLPDLESFTDQFRVRMTRNGVTIVSEMTALPAILKAMTHLVHEHRTLVLLGAPAPGEVSVAQLFDRLVMVGTVMPDLENGRLNETFTVPTLPEAIDLAARLRKPSEMWLVAVEKLEPTLGMMG